MTVKLKEIWKDIANSVNYVRSDDRVPPYSTDYELDTDLFYNAQYDGVNIIMYFYDEEVILPAECFEIMED